MTACSSGSSSSRRSRLVARSRSAQRIRARLAALVAVLFAFSLAARSSQGEDVSRESNRSLMNDVSQRFRLLETRLAAGDSDGVARIATELGDLRGRLARIPPEVNTSLADEFERHVARFGELLDETAGLASKDRLSDAGGAFEDLRATCVSCHLKFRSNNAERGNYPARFNTISGEIELRDADGGIRQDRSWVLVFLEGSTASAPPHQPRGNPRISQSGRRFQPRVLPVVVGTQVDFPNDDTIFHNVFSLSKTAPFDLGVYEPGQSSSVRMERTGLVKVYCNIHPDMAASIVVLSNPWYALTDRAGQFVICAVPDGDYVLRTWNDMGAESREPIQVSGGAVYPARAELRETRRAVSHTNKYGKTYPEKY